MGKTDTPDSWRAGWRSGGRAGQPTGQRAGGERAGYTSRMAGELGGWLIGYYSLGGEGRLGHRPFGNQVVFAYLQQNSLCDLVTTLYLPDDLRISNRRWHVKIQVRKFWQYKMNA